MGYQHLTANHRLRFVDPFLMQPQIMLNRCGPGPLLRELAM